MKIFDTKGDLLKILAISHQTVFFGTCKESGLLTFNSTLEWALKTILALKLNVCTVHY
jgi:hypothetical protein